jgi:hypothetical protein
MTPLQCLVFGACAAFAAFAAWLSWYINRPEGRR